MRIAYFGRIVMVGNSHAVTIPRNVRIINELKKGDIVKIEISKVVEEDESNLHDNSTAQQDPEARMERDNQDT